MVYTTNTGAGGSVAQGVQQAFFISVETAIPETEGIELKMLVYPNPTTDYLILKISSYDSNNLSYRLFDIGGKLIKLESLESDMTRIVMQNMKSAVYFLKIFDDKKEIKIFKIIKK